MIDYMELITQKCRGYYIEKNKISPMKMAIQIMSAEGFPMHSPHHHYLTAAVLLTSACIAEEKDEDTYTAYMETAKKRALKVPGAYCGEYGACGAAIGCGIFSCVWNGTTPHSTDTLGTANLITSMALKEIAKYPGCRCCKRVTFLSLISTCRYMNEKMDMDIKEDKIICGFFKMNDDGCRKEQCEFYPAKP